MEYCKDCGMPVVAGEYHPFAACLLFRQTGDSEVVRMNLSAVMMQGELDESARIRRELLEAIEPEIRMHRIPGSQTEIECVMMSTLRFALDRICPEKE